MNNIIIMCDQCQRLVTDVRFWYDSVLDCFALVVYCHGSSDYAWLDLEAPYIFQLAFRIDYSCYNYSDEGSSDAS